MVDYFLLASVLTGIAVLLVLILVFRIQAFLALLISSITVGLLAGMSPEKIVEAIQTGMASTLGFIAVIIGLGAMFGALLEHSGGVQSLAAAILKKTGEKKAPWALVVTGFLVGIPVFFDVGFIILVPVVYALQKKTSKSLLAYGIPLLAGLAITHAFIPPTPGPVAVAEILDANLGWVILVGFIAGVPAAIISGPLFAKFISKRIFLEAKDFADPDPNTNFPSASMILFLVGLPIFLIVLNTTLSSPLAANLPLSENVISWIKMLGHPFIALLIANLLAWYLLGIRRGFKTKALLEITSRSLAPAGLIILITGAGGVFKQMLTETGAGKMLATAMASYQLSYLVFAFLTAAIIRVVQGSATVAMITAAGMTAAFIEGNMMTDMQKALLVISIASGATIFSHVNDSGFWLVSKYFGMNEKQTLASWSVVTVLISITGFATVILLNFFIS
jgi:Gnt-I system low-affinity gluconate transporter